MLPSPPRKPAFSLTELLVVVAVIAILLAIVIPALSGVRVRLASSRDVANLRQIHSAWMLASQDNNNEPVPGSTNEGQRYQRHWPGKLSKYLSLTFPENQYSMFLDYDTLPENTVLSPGPSYDVYVEDRKKIGYAINYLVAGTYFSSGYRGPLKGDGSRIGNPKLSDITSTSIVFASADGTNWHLGTSVADFGGQPMLGEGYPGIPIRASYDGSANFIRFDGSAFSSDVFPDRKNWTVDGNE